MRFGFVTCVQLGLSCIQQIHDLGGRLDLLVTLEDDLARRKSGRVYLDEVAAVSDTPLHKCHNINDPLTVEAIRAADLDWLFIIGWSQIARDGVLDSTRRGVLGMHPTLLPQGRGRASVPWAIIKALDETGVTLFQLDRGIDTGPILGQERILVTPGETATTLYAKVIDAHLSLMRHVWIPLTEDLLDPRKQDESASSEWPGRLPSDGEISRTMSVSEVDRLVRATTRPYPGAFVATEVGLITIWKGMPKATSTHPPDCIAIELADGTFLATHYEVRAL